jgi:hypothetical protein
MLLRDCSWTFQLQITIHFFFYFYSILNNYRWPPLVRVVEHDCKNWLQRVQHQIGIENEMNRIVKPMAKECGSDY